MKPHKLQVKLFFEEPKTPSVEKFVPVFHRWVKTKAIDGELLIDVADYSHVHDGPAVLLVGHGSDYYVDLDEGRPGILFSRKRAGPPEADRLKDTFRRAFEACHLLEKESSLAPMRFRTSELLFRVSDRLLAPNRDETFDELGPELFEFVDGLFGSGSAELERKGTGREQFSVTIRADGAPDVKTLLDRLS